MTLQTIKSSQGQVEYVLLPVEAYHLLKKRIDKALRTDYGRFELKDYGQNPLALARIKAGLTQDELANYLNVTQPYISKLENQEHVSPRVLEKCKKIITAHSRKSKLSH